MATRKENRLPEFVVDVQKRAARAMTQALILGAAEASVLTPIGLTSNLLNSQIKRSFKRGAKVIGRVSYTASYATYVHNPVIKQKFRRATAEKEFLRKGFERAESNIRAVLKGGLKK